MAIDRLPQREEPRQVPRQTGPGLFEVDATWGTPQPIEWGSGVKTVGELELIDHLEERRPVVDTRLEHYHREATIPGAVGIPHEQMTERIEELDRSVPTIFFCNGPQCTATPDAIDQLLGAGYPAEAILYYRGGIHDWMTLGYPVAPPKEAR